MLGVVKGIKPKDHHKAMLAAQMVAIHMATMTFTRRLAQVENIAHGMPATSRAGYHNKSG
jgi:hypothetical protein